MTQYSLIVALALAVAFGAVAFGLAIPQVEIAPACQEWRVGGAPYLHCER